MVLFTPGSWDPTESAWDPLTIAPTWDLPLKGGTREIGMGEFPLEAEVSGIRVGGEVYVR